MGFLSWLGIGPSPSPAVLPTSPWQSGDLEQITIATLFGDATPDGVVTLDIAKRVPGLRRASLLHCGIVAGAPFRQYEGATLIADQPKWLSSSESTVSPYLRNFGVTHDLFWYGWACIGAQLDGQPYPVDGIHVPVGMWSQDPLTGKVTIDERIPAKYRELAIVIPFGANGVLVDGIDTIRAARYIETAWQDRIANPIAQTDLHITDSTISLSRKDKLKLAEQYNEGRKLPGGATSVTDAFLEAKHHDAPADLFESGRNAVRLDLANHALVPASIIEGAKNGSAGEINYSNDASKRNETYDYGTSLFVQAIEARLSMDDVCPTGQSIRGDLSGFMAVPTPAESPARED